MNLLVWIIYHADMLCFFPTSLCGVLVFGCALPPLRSRLPSPARRLSSPHNSVDIVESEAGIQGLDHACTQHTTRCGDASVPNAQGRVQETDYIVSGRGRWFSVKPTHPRDDQVPVWRRGRRRCLCGRRGTWRH